MSDLIVPVPNHCLFIHFFALWALSYIFSMARMMLALMLYFLIVAHKAVLDKMSDLIVPVPNHCLFIHFFFHSIVSCKI